MKFDKRGRITTIIALVLAAQVYAVEADAPAREGEHRDTIITVSPLFGCPLRLHGTRDIGRHLGSPWPRVRVLTVGDYALAAEGSGA